MSRLLNLCKETPAEKPTRGKWLSDEIENYISKNGVESDSEPTEEEISKQIR